MEFISKKYPSISYEKPLQVAVLNFKKILPFSEKK